MQGEGKQCTVQAPADLDNIGKRHSRGEIETDRLKSQAFDCKKSLTVMFHGLSTPSAGAIGSVRASLTAGSMSTSPATDLDLAASSGNRTA